jgi:WD40 repeat protein
VSQDGRYVASGGWDQVVAVWDRQERRVRTLRKHAGQVRDVEFFPGTHELVSVGTDGLVQWWNVDTEETRTLHRADSEAYRVGIAADGRYVIATTKAGPVIVIDRTDRTGGAVQVAKGPTRRSNEALVVGDRLFATSQDGALYAWSMADLAAAPTVHRLGSGVTRTIAYAPGSGLLVTNWGSSIVTSTVEGRVVARHSLPGYGVNDLVVSADERYVAAATSNGDIFMVDLERGDVAVRKVSDDQSRAVLFTADDRALYTTDSNGRVLRCDVSRWKFFADRAYQQ